jgi:protein TonB
MYANRYTDGYGSPKASRPFSMGAALLLNGGIVAGLMFGIAPKIVPGILERPLETRNIPLPPDPPRPQPQEQKQVVERKTTQPLHQPPVNDVTPPTGPVLGTTPNPVIPTYDPPGATGPGSAGVTVDPPVAPPVMVEASMDSRYAGAFQPDYPGPELRQEKEGVVRVRVLIGTDGRIKAVEQIASPTPGFFEATRRHALNKWRFKPATRDGIPVESWKTMSVRFRITT